MDDERADDSAGVLCTEVRVIPSGAVQICVELVCKGLSRCNRTLSDTRNAILIRCTLLEETVPVQSRAFFRTLDSVVNGDLHSITPVGLNGGSRILSVDKHHIDLDSIRRVHTSGYGEVVRSNDPSDGSVFVWIGASGCATSPRRLAWFARAWKSSSTITACSMRATITIRATPARCSHEWRELGSWERTPLGVAICRRLW